MSDDVRADARRLLEKHADKADLSLDAPTSLDDIRERLARCARGCRCDDGDHENAVHDLATSDVPVLLAAFEDALAELDRAKTEVDGRRAVAAVRRDQVVELTAERDAALATLRQVRDEAVEVMNYGGMSAREFAEKIIYLIADGGGAR